MKSFYGIKRIGLFLDEEETGAFIKELKKDYKECWSEDDILCGFEPNDGCVVDYRFVSGSMQRLNGGKEDLQNGPLIFARRQGGILKGSTYSGPDEMAKEFEDRYGKYLPEDFDYASHLVRLTGVQCL